MEEKSRALGGRLARAADAYATSRSLPTPLYWSKWHIVTSIWRGSIEGEPTIIFPPSAPEGYEAFARVWPRKNA